LSAEAVREALAKAEGAARQARATRQSRFDEKHLERPLIGPFSFGIPYVMMLPERGIRGKYVISSDGRWNVRVLLGLGLVIALIVGYVGFMWITYTCKSITEGSGYGYQIGSSKEESLSTAEKLYRKKQITLGCNRYNEEDPENNPINIKKDANLFYKEDEWEFYFSCDSSVTLSFENNLLVEIHRHRQYFELP